jgi:hypothetical protein
VGILRKSKCVQKKGSSQQERFHLSI